jgi:hypothetical protein
VHLSSRLCGTIAGRQFARASENTLFAQEFPCRLSTDCVLLSHALDRLEELFELLLAHEITVNLPSKFIRKMRHSQVEECKRHPLSRKARSMIRPCAELSGTSDNRIHFRGPGIFPRTPFPWLKNLNFVESCWVAMNRQCPVKTLALPAALATLAMPDIGRCGARQ